MKLAALTDGRCAYCGVSPKDHARCAICEASNQVVRVCAWCKEWLERNEVPWNDRKLDSLEDVDDDESESPKKLTQRTRSRPLRDGMKPTRSRGRPRDPRIDEAVIPRLLFRHVRVTVERIDRFGRNRGTYQIWYKFSRREIAALAGCSQDAVDRRYRDIRRARKRQSRATSARRLT